jgi:hypothetical protein
VLLIIVEPLLAWLRHIGAIRLRAVTRDIAPLISERSSVTSQLRWRTEASGWAA